MNRQDLLSRVRDVAATSEGLGRLLRRFNAALEGDGEGPSDGRPPPGPSSPAGADIAPLLARTKQTLADVADLLATSERLVAASQVTRGALAAPSRALVAAVRGQSGADRARLDRAMAALARSRALLERTDRAGDGRRRGIRHAVPPRDGRAALAPLLRKLERLGPLSDEGRRALEGIPLNPRRVAARGDLVREGERATHCQVLLEGWACRYKLAGDGKRQIMGFYLPGDVVDLTGLLLGETDHAVAALTPVRVTAVPHATVLGWTRPHPDLVHLLWRDTLIDAAVFREWMVNVGRRSARQRTAHLLCELVARVRAFGPADGDAYLLPITQVELADALGLSAVHVNRMLQDMRGEGLIEWAYGTLLVRDWDGLRQAGGFDPGYLHHLAAAG